ncbi:MAG: hypothetical protein U1E65_17160 [Myxococcota bacterium]
MSSFGVQLPPYLWLAPAPRAEPRALHRHLAALLQSVHGKTSPRRFALSDKEKKNRKRGRSLQGEALEAFFASLDAHLMPASFKDDPALHELWELFWSIRMESWGMALARYIEEARRTEARTIDLMADHEEILALERRIQHAFAHSDMDAVRKAAQGPELDEVDAALALWTAHLSSWRALVLREDPIREVGARTSSEKRSRVLPAPTAPRAPSQAGHGTPMYALRTWHE